jgi:hypothetical protein
VYDALHAPDLLAQAVIVGDVTLPVFGALDLEAGAAADHPNVMTVPHEALYGSTADVPGPPGDENVHGLSFVSGPVPATM